MKLLCAAAVAAGVWYFWMRPRNVRFIDSHYIDPARFLPWPRQGIDPGAMNPAPRRGIDPGR